MLGQCVRAKVVKPVGFVDESNYVYPLNFALLYDTPKDEYAFIIGIDHAVKNFDGRIIALLEPKSKQNNRIWILAPKSTRFINLDILKYIDMENAYKNYKLTCLYESSSGAVVYRNINGDTRFLLIKNKRSANWGFPKGHLEMGETKVDAAKREVLEETGIHIRLHEGFETVSKYKIKNRIDKRVSIFVGTTEDTNTRIQETEIEDYIWLPYDKAMPYLKFDNDKNILKKAYEFLTANKYITC
ncbi:MAG: NUDIX domain-containing protein [Clostridium sp.]|nr:NUDIX domain-containing protein [Clostridium sp.]